MLRQDETIFVEPFTSRSAQNAQHPTFFRRIGRVNRTVHNDVSDMSIPARTPH